MSFLIWITSFSLLSSDLIKYYNGEVKLSDKELLALCQKVIEANTSNYLSALAYYQTAILHRKTRKNYDAFEAYSNAYRLLSRADTIDNYLEFNIRRNQGVILEGHGFLFEAAKKHEEALPFAYQYNRKSGLSVKYNWGSILAGIDPEKSMKIFLEALNEAEDAGLQERKARIYDEIGKMFIRSGEYEGAKEFFLKGLGITSNKFMQARLLKDLSSSYYFQGNYPKQEELLKQSLKIFQGVKRFDVLRDLGECYLMQEKPSEALKFLLEAEEYYSNQYLAAENIKVYEWLAKASPDSTKYWKVFGREFEKMADEKEKIGGLLKQEGMQQLLMRLDAEREKETKVAFYKTWTIIIGTGMILVILMWRIWWRRLQKGVSSVLDDFETKNREN